MPSDASAGAAAGAGGSSRNSRLGAKNSVPVFAVRVLDHRQRHVRVGRLDVIGQLEIGQLGAADDALLLLGAARVPCLEVVQVPLDP